MSRHERRSGKRAARKTSVTDQGVRVKRSRGRERLTALVVFAVALMMLVTVLPTPEPEQPPIPDDVRARLDGAGVEWRRAGEQALVLIEDLDFVGVAARAASFLGLDEQAPPRTSYLIELRSTDEAAPDEFRDWKPALGFRFDGVDLEFNGQRWQEVIIWADADALTPMFTSGITLHPDPVAVPEPVIELLTPSTEPVVPTAAPDGDPTFRPIYLPPAAVASAAPLGTPAD